MPDLSSKVAIVTGAAAGIGKASATALARCGASVLCNDLNLESMKKVVEQITNDGGTAFAFGGDVTRRETLDDLVKTAVQQHGQLDILHNNAAASIIGVNIGDLTDEQWRSQQQLVLDSVFFGTRAALPQMIAQRSGSIINTASATAFSGLQGQGAYAANKAAVITLTLNVAMEYAEYGIRCNAITPGMTDTPALRGFLDDMEDVERNRWLRGIILGRLTQPEEVANIVTWLASDEASSISGTVIQSNMRVANGRGQ